MTYDQFPSGWARPPHAIGAEQSVLGAILINNAFFHEIAGVVGEDDFFEPVHARIFAYARRQIEAGRIADPITLRAAFQDDPQLRAAIQGSDGGQYLAEIVRNAETIATAKRYALEVRLAAGRRALMQAAEQAMARAADEEMGATLEEQIADLRFELDRVQGYTTGDTWRSIADVISDSMSRLMAGGEACWSTGMPTLDTNMGGGLHAGATYGFEARMKSFKTGVLGTIAYGLMRLPEPPPFLFVALEMGAGRILERLVSAETSCNAVRFRKPTDRDDLIGRLTTFRDRYGHRHGYFADEPGLSFTKLRSILADAVNKLGVRVVFIDYWQLITGRSRSQSNAEFLTEVAQWLAAFAAKERIAVVIASQSNREGESFGSDGLMKACDWLARIHKLKQHTVSLGDYEGIWLEIRANRDGPDGDIGSEDNPAFRIDKRGPVLRDCWAGASA